MLAKVLSSAVIGIDAYVVEVEVGFPLFPPWVCRKGPSGKVKSGLRLR